MSPPPDSEGGQQPDARTRAREIIMGKVPAHSGPIGFLRAYLVGLQRYFITGLLVWVPLIVTAWICWWVTVTLGGGIESTIEWFVGYLNDLGTRFELLGFLSAIEYRRGLGLATAVVLFLATGLFARYLVLRRIIDLGEAIVDRIPLVSRVYRAVQQIRDVFVNREGTVFQGVCVLEYPKKDSWVVGFITSREPGPVQSVAGLSLVAVFVPTTPNPTSGFLLYVPDEDLKVLDMSVEDAMKLIVSGGAYLPPNAPRPEVAGATAHDPERGAA